MTNSLWMWTCRCSYRQLLSVFNTIKSIGTLSVLFFENFQSPNSSLQFDLAVKSEVWLEILQPPKFQVKSSTMSFYFRSAHLASAVYFRFVNNPKLFLINQNSVKRTGQLTCPLCPFRSFFLYSSESNNVPRPNGRINRLDTVQWTALIPL